MSDKFPLTLRGSSVVMTVASIKGLGRFAVSSIRLCHCRGSPTNFCSCSSKSVCTRCSKLEGAEIWILDFFFLVNMVASGHHTCIAWKTMENQTISIIWQKISLCLIMYSSSCQYNLKCLKHKVSLYLKR